MLETKDLYKDYIDAINTKIVMVDIKIGQYIGSQEYIRTCIVNNRAEFENVNVDIDVLFANPYIAYAKIKTLVDNGQLTRVAHYIKSYVTSIQYLNTHKLLKERLTKSIMPYEVYLKLIGYSNFEIAKHILKGGIYKLGHVGKIYIKQKARTFIFMGRPCKLGVDWGLSNKYKAQLIAEGKVPYDSNTAPDGVKWHIYHNSDYAYWFWWESGNIPNRLFFRFIPSKFTRPSKKPFTSAEEIYETREIGIVNKMWELIRSDSMHFMNYKRPEKIFKPIFGTFVNA